MVEHIRDRAKKVLDVSRSCWFHQATLAVMLSERKAGFHYYWRERTGGMYVAVGRRQNPVGWALISRAQHHRRVCADNKTLHTLFFMDEP